MTDAREVIAEALEDTGILLQLAAADSILQALEQAGYVVIDRRALLLINQTASEPINPPSS